MKIAVATVDGKSMSQHFGQSAGFIVFEVEGTAIKHRELRTNQQTPHDEGICDHHGSHGHGQGNGAHNHNGIARLIGDCQVVLCGGMGAGAANALIQQGIKPAVLAITGPAEEAVSQYLNGPTTAAPSTFCQCHH